MLSKELLAEIKGEIDPRGANANVLSRLIDAIAGEIDEAETFETRETEPNQGAD